MFNPLRQGSGVFSTTYNKNVALETQPHYSDTRFIEAQTVFGDPAPDMFGHGHLSYDYSDRLWQWDYEKMKAGFALANDTEGITKRSCRYYEIALSHYFDREIVIRHIIAGVNHGTGYPYCVFGYEKEEAL